MEPSSLILLCFGIGSCLLLWRYLTPSCDPAEPPVLWPKIPIIGHAIGLATQKSSYYKVLRTRCQAPVYTLPLPNSKMYIVNSLDTIQAMQRRSQDFSAHQFVVEFTTTVCGLSKPGSAILHANHVKATGSDNPHDVFQIMRVVLGPGASLDCLNRGMIANVAGSLQRLAEGAAPKRIMLQDWLNHEITMATSGSVFGPMNPYNDPKVEAAFREFNKHIMTLMVKFLPNVLAKKGTTARDIVAKAFVEYLQKGGHEQGSELARKRVAYYTELGLPQDDVARLEVGNSIALLINTNPTVFWVVWHLFASPDALAACRAEIAGIMTTVPRSGDDARPALRRLDIARLKAHCPYLLGVFQEVLRLRTAAGSVRRVARDVTLSDRLLKQGTVLYNPAAVFQTDPALWGADVAAFRPERWLKGSGAPAVKPVAMRPFGGGETLCPGRHFATTETLAVAAMMVMRFDLKPVAGKWEAPTTKKTNLASAVLHPDWDVEVEVTPRPEFAGDEWEFALNDSKNIFAIAAEDKPEE